MHLLFGLLVWGSPGAMMGAYGNMYYGMMRFGTPAFGVSTLLVSLILGIVAGAFVGWLIAASYNWGLENKAAA